MKDTTIIYHGNCYDGFTAAWVAWRKFGDDGATYFPAGYGEAPPWELIDGKNVYIVDFSYKRPVMLEIAWRAATLVVLDHHKTAEADLAGIEAETAEPGSERSNVRVYFDMNRSGAMMALDYWFPDTPGTPERQFVEYIQDRDLWQWKLPQSRAVSAAIRLVPQTFEEWDELPQQIVDDYKFQLLVGRGEASLATTDGYIRDITKPTALWRMVNLDMWSAGTDVSRQWKGKWGDGESPRFYPVPCVNAPFWECATLGERLCEGHPFSIVWWHRSDGKFQFSLRSRGEDAIDVSEIAKVFGGGGHRNAAGFQLDRLPEWVTR